MKNCEQYNDDFGVSRPEAKRQSDGRSTEEVTQARRLHVLSLYSSGLTREIYRYVEGLGYSRKTAEVDIT